MEREETVVKKNRIEQDRAKIKIRAQPSSPVIYSLTPSPPQQKTRRKEKDSPRSQPC